ncbi:linear amide C-N hydrolase [Roseomonas marmotae]|uniref:linear amide C-N hydrolase n=1 Tax=Roseomonas marmotae TaxID=2768161 RepID=UPI001AD6ABAD|nr:linear amide C-N hydrolase [Roseomonas marmotae]QTI80394.1 linear amide C-N hydrolase [Roseomonas marmotae]
MVSKVGRVTAAGLVAAFFATTVADGASACSRILSNGNGQANVVARTMDLNRPDDAKMVVYPRGSERVSKTGDGKSFNWTSKLGSVAVTALGAATSDGMNEKGLVANLLYLGDTKYERRDNRPGLSNLLWAQYVLDNFGSVKEAVEGLKAVQIVPVEHDGKHWPLHLAISDAEGDSAIVEFVDGRMIVHQGKEFTVMTNEPPLETQLKNVRNYKLFGGTKPLPGDIDPESRFVRAASYLKTLPPARSVPEAIAGAQSIARNVAVPPGAKDTSGSVAEDAWPTLWFTLADSTNKTYFFHSARSPNLYWVDLTKIDFGSKAGERAIDAYDWTLAGDITQRLTNAN